MAVGVARGGRVGVFCGGLVSGRGNPRPLPGRERLVRSGPRPGGDRSDGGQTVTGFDLELLDRDRLPVAERTWGGN